MNSVKITEKDGEYILYANGEEASHTQINIFPEVKNFDWILLCDVYTMPKYQRQGYAKMLLKRVLKDCEKEHPTYGQYLTVMAVNTPAIGLYKGLGFEVIRTLTQKKTKRKYLVMARGKADRDQLMNTGFAGFE